MENALASILSSMLGSLPNVHIGKHFHNTNFLIGKKVFAFIKDGGVVIKLPKETIQKIMDQKYVSPLVMGKRVMKEWMVIKHEDPEEYKKDLELFKDAIIFVASR